MARVAEGEREPAVEQGDGGVVGHAFHQGQHFFDVGLGVERFGRVVLGVAFLLA